MTARDQVLATIKDIGSVTPSEVSERTALSLAEVQAALDDLVGAGEVVEGERAYWVPEPDE